MRTTLKEEVTGLIYRHFRLYLGDVPIGRCWLTTDGEPATTLYCVNIDKAYRGRGYGQELIQHAIAVAKTYSARLNLFVDPKNAKAIHIYEKFGFEATDYKNDHNETRMVLKWRKKRCERAKLEMRV